MKLVAKVVVAVYVGALAGGHVVCAAGDRARLPGRQVKVAAIAMGFGGDNRHDERLRLALDHLDTAGREGADIACLPEEFSGTTAEPIPGPTTNAVAAAARKHRMYVICPVREQSADGRQYNTAVLLDRSGRIAGRYRKVFVFWGEGLDLGREGVGVFDADFGRIAMLTCFDANFDEVWQEAERKGAEIVFWPSAYGGGMPLAGYAMIHNYYVVPVGRGNLIDVFGRMIETRQPRPQQFVATLDLDRTLVHTNFNEQKVARLLREHPGEVVQERFLEMEAWYVLRSVKPGVRVRDLCKQYRIETLREYRQRSRREINDARGKGKKI
jgi:hypothetical protein